MLALITQLEAYVYYQDRTYPGPASPMETSLVGTVFSPCPYFIGLKEQVLFTPVQMWLVFLVSSIAWGACSEA